MLDETTDDGKPCFLSPLPNSVLSFLSTLDDNGKVHHICIFRIFSTSLTTFFSSPFSSSPFCSKVPPIQAWAVEGNSDIVPISKHARLQYSSKLHRQSEIHLCKIKVLIFFYILSDPYEAYDHICFSLEDVIILKCLLMISHV